MRESSPGTGNSPGWSEEGTCQAGHNGRTPEMGTPLPPHTITPLPISHPVRSAHVLQHTGLLKLLSYVPWKRFPRTEGSYYSSWEILLQSPGWASGYSKGRRITGKMIPGHAGRFHIIKQALFLSSQHPGPTQVRLSGHRVLGGISCEALGPLFSLQG